MRQQEEDDLEIRDIRILCNKGQAISVKILKAYFRFLKSHSPSLQVYSSEEIDLSRDEWQNFVTNLCSKESINNKPHKILIL